MLYLLTRCRLILKVLRHFSGFWLAIRYTKVKNVHLSQLQPSVFMRIFGIFLAQCLEGMNYERINRIVKIMVRGGCGGRTKKERKMWRERRGLKEW